MLNDRPHEPLPLLLPAWRPPCCWRPPKPVRGRQSEAPQPYRRVRRMRAASEAARDWLMPYSSLRRTAMLWGMLLLAGRAAHAKRENIVL
eukprot:COSAG01_NODE_50065_length_366_cov_2.535581_1_plen_89_part_01